MKSLNRLIPIFGLLFSSALLAQAQIDLQISEDNSDGFVPDQILAEYYEIDVTNAEGSSFNGDIFTVGEILSTNDCIGANADDLSDDCFDLSDPIEMMRNDCTGCDAEGGELAAVSGDVLNRLVVANRNSGDISVIDLGNNEVINSFDLPGNAEPMYTVYNSSNNTVLVGDYNGSVVAFDAVDFSVAGSVQTGNGVFHMWLSPDYEELWVNNELDTTISVVNPNSMSILTTFSIPEDLLELGYQPHDVVVSPDNFAFITFFGPGENGYVVKYDTGTFAEVARATVGNDPHLSLTPANEKLYVACQASSELIVLNRGDLSEVSVLSIPNAHDLGMNHDGTYLYVGNILDGGSNAIFTLDLSDNTLVGEGVDTPFSFPHNFAVAEGDETLFITHSGNNGSKVSIYELNPTPTFVSSVEVGTNPFGLVTYSYQETSDEISICVGDGIPDPIDVTLEGNVGENMAWVITDSDLNILDLPSGSPFDLDNGAEGTCLIWNLSWTGELNGVEIGANAGDLSGECFDLSNPVEVVRQTCTLDLPHSTWEYDLSMAPTPTEGDAIVTYTTNKNSHTKISIFNLNGKSLKVLFDQNTAAGVKYTIPFDGNNLPCGMYMLQITDGQSAKMQKFMIAR